MSVPTAAPSAKGTVYFDEPPIARTLFASTKFAWLWLILRLYLGWEWFVAGWGKTFGGNITWKFWNWDAAFGLPSCWPWLRVCGVASAWIFGSLPNCRAGTSSPFTKEPSKRR